jgi:hypothetical protein
MRILVLDEIVVKPGLAETYRQAYREGYVPAAEARGMRLDGAWQNPPGRDYDELATTLYYLWSVDGAQGWWAMRRSRTADGLDERYQKHAWWQESDRMVEHRARKFLTDQPEGN